MDISNIEIKLVDDPHHKFLGFAKIVLGEVLVIHDIKIIDGMDGMFVAMPTRKATERCPRCKHKNHLRARFCNDCGGQLSGVHPDETKYYHDIVHPIVSGFRYYMEDCILNEYENVKGRVVLSINKAPIELAQS